MVTPVICVDGPSGAGKGTLARRLAEKLGFAYLDSGAIYRVLAVLVQKQGIEVSDLGALSELARNIRVEFVGNEVLFEGEDLSPKIRLEQTASLASQLAAFPEVREALVESQRSYVSLSGLVADGRDMGTTIFPDAPLKIYLIASSEERAKRRLKQLQELHQKTAEDGSVIAGGENKKKDANSLINKTLIQGDTGDSLRALVKDIEFRDERDMNRETSPLRPADNAIKIDCTSMSADQVLDQVLCLWASHKV